LGASSADITMGCYWYNVMVDSKRSKTPRLHSLYILKQLNCVHQEHQEFEGATFWNYIYFWFDLLPLTSYPICWVKTFQRLWHCRLGRLDSCHGLVSLHHWGNTTRPETNSEFTPENWPIPKGNSSSNQWFSGYILVSGECSSIYRNCGRKQTIGGAWIFPPTSMAPSFPAASA